MFRHVLPNAAAPALVYGMVDAVNNVSIGAALRVRPFALGNSC